MADLFGATKTMKAISLWQPWPTLIAVGLKIDETRHWPVSHRGAIAIHAAKVIDYAGAPAALCHDALGPGWWDKCPLGAVVAIARLTSCRPTHEGREGLTRANLASGNFLDGRYAWRLNDIRPLAEPIPTLGRQGLFNWTPPDDLDARLMAATDHQAACRRAGWL